jgi:hypothetical protein
VRDNLSGARVASVSADHIPGQFYIDHVERLTVPQSSAIKPFRRTFCWRLLFRYSLQIRTRIFRGIVIFRRHRIVSQTRQNITPPALTAS